MESAGGAAYFFPWCQLNFVTYRWAILGAILHLSLPVWQLSTALKETDSGLFFLAFAQMGLWPHFPSVADLCPGWGMKGFSVLYQSSSLANKGQLWDMEKLLTSSVARGFSFAFNRIQDTGFVPIISLYAKHLENRWASAGTHIHSEPLVNLTHLYY